MSINFSLHLIPDDLEILVQRAKLADEAGFEHLWIAESHLACRDVYAGVALCLLNTDRITVGPGTTNVILRDNTITANTISTLYEVAPGRVILGLGTGDTPIYSLGKKAATLATMRKAIAQIRSLVRGEVVDYNGVPVSISWSHYDIPIYLAAAGPKTLQLAAEVADGVIISSGVYPETIAWAQQNLDIGMQRRDPALRELDITYAAMCSVDSDEVAAREKVRARVANRAHHNFWKTLESVPPEHRDEVRRLMDQFDIRNWRSPKHAHLVTDYLLDRFAITGTPEQCIKRIREIESLGVKRLMIDPPSKDFDESLEMFVGEVMPQLKSTEAS